jgi:PKD repeat protein
MKTVDFLSTVVGLNARFRAFADELPHDFTVTWVFGDGKTESHVGVVTASHLYENPGDYVVKVTITNNYGGENLSKTHVIGVSDQVNTQLPGSIYELIDTYIPEDIFGKVSLKEKQQFIEKWQLYIQPLVNHEIPIEEFNNELYYEALENQLIMELAAYDYMVVQISLMVGATAESVKDSNSTSSSESESESESSESSRGSGEVKRIQTGPTEVEFFNDTDSESKTSSNVIKAMQPGGVIDILKQNLCMLAERLSIYLPICRTVKKVVVPKVVNHRRPGPLDGPDPGFPVKK